MIGKISLVAFWGYVGTSLIEGLKNQMILLIQMELNIDMFGEEKLLMVEEQMIFQKWVNLLLLLIMI